MKFSLLKNIVLKNYLRAKEYCVLLVKGKVVFVVYISYVQFCFYFQCY